MPVEKSYFRERHFLIIGGDELIWNLLCHYYDQASAERRRPRCPCHRFLTWIFFSYYFLFFFFHFWFLSLGFIFWKKLFWENFFEKSRATKIIFRTKFKITSKLFSVFISNSTVLFTGHVTLFNSWHPKNDLFRFRTSWNMFKQSKFKIIFKLNFW